MGWASGSSLMSEVIAAIYRPTPAIEGGRRREVYAKLIDAFRSMDCDTLSECTGEDPEFDAAFGEAYPYWGGWDAAGRGEAADDCPFPGNGDGRRDEWLQGWQDGQED